jgi:hypothetical protein
MKMAYLMHNAAVQGWNNTHIHKAIYFSDKTKTVHKMSQRATVSSIFKLSAMLGCHQEQHVQYKAEILFYI